MTDTSTSGSAAAETTPPQAATPTPTPAPTAKPKAAPAPAPVTTPEPTPVTALATPAPTPPSPAVTPPPTPAPTPVPLSQAATIVVELLANYRQCLSVKNGTPVAFKNAAKLLSSVVQRLLLTPEPDVLMAVWTFFVDNKAGILQESAALQGMEAVDAQARFKAEIVYHLFRQATRGVDIGNSKKISLALVNSRLKCPKLILFLQAQAQRVASGKSA